MPKESPAKFKKTKKLLVYLVTKIKNLGDLWKSSIVCLAGALVSYYMQKIWPYELLGHISFAFLVAGILAWTIEYQARKRTQEFERNLANNVFQGILTHFVPPAVFEEIDFFLRERWVKKDCEYIITFDRPFPGMSDDYFVIRRESSFVVDNLTPREIVFPIKSSYSDHPDRTPEGWTGDFHLGMEIEKKAIAGMETEKKVIAKEDLAELISKERDFTSMEYALKLGPHESASVYLCGQEPSRIEAGSNSYTQSTTTIGLRVDIRNLYPEVIQDIKVFMHHPSYAKMTERPGGLYALNKAFLPGQGFEIRWRTVRSGCRGGDLTATN